MSITRNVSTPILAAVVFTVTLIGFLAYPALIYTLFDNVNQTLAHALSAVRH
jgi:hypothetical protein